MAVAFLSGETSISCRDLGRLAKFVVEADASDVHVKIAQRVSGRKAVEGERVRAEPIKLVVKKLAADRPVAVFKGIFEPAANHPAGLRIADAHNEKVTGRDGP